MNKLNIKNAWIAGALAALVALALGSTTAAAHSRGAAKVRSGQTTLELSSQTASALQADGIALAAKAPAGASGNSFTFPVKRGRVNRTTLRGWLAHAGGVTLTKGRRSVKLARPVIVSTRRGAFVLVGVWHRHRLARSARRGHGRRVIRHRGHWHALRLLTLSNVKHADQGGNAVVTADAAMAKQGAKLLNRRLGTTVFAAGAAVGTTTVTIPTPA